MGQVAGAIPPLAMFLRHLRQDLLLEKRVIKDPRALSKQLTELFLSRQA
jgi:hypothetical protein